MVSNRERGASGAIPGSSVQGTSIVVRLCTVVYRLIKTDITLADNNEWCIITLLYLAFLVILLVSGNIGVEGVGCRLQGKYVKSK